MRIKEDFHEDCEEYSEEIKQRVADTFHKASQISELLSLLEAIRKSTDNIRGLFLTEEELKERREISEKFDSEMQTTVYRITENLESYRQEGWKKLFGKGEIGDE